MCLARRRRAGIRVGWLAAVAIAAWGAQDADQQSRAVESGLLRRVQIKGQAVERATMAERLQHYHVPGLSVAVVDGGALGWAKGYGSGKASEAVTPETLFQAASISKPVAAMVALRLVEQGKLALDEDVNVKLKSWKLPASEAAQGEPVTLRRILSHSAGLSVHGFPGYARGEAVPKLRELLEGAKPANSQAVRVELKPGTQMRYSGGGYEVMQQLVEDVTGKPFAAVAQELVLGPLGMTHSTYEQPLPEGLRGAAATAYGPEGEAIAGEWHTYPEQAAAGLWTTPSDLTKVIREIQKPGRVLKAQTVEQMLTPVLDHWGLGFELSDTGGRKAFRHGGSNEGFRCMLSGYREGGQGAVVMTNGDNGSPLADEVLAALGAQLGWPDFRPVQKSLVELPAEKVARYAGVYQVPDGPRITVRPEGKTLLLEPEGFPKAELLPESEDTFFDPDGGAPDIHFERGQDGVWRLSAGPMVAKRVQ